MKIVQINTFPNKAPGTIMMNIHKELLEQGHESYVVWGRGRKANNEYEICINDKIGTFFHGIYTRLSDKTGFASTRATKKLLRELDKINPDIIHLHNIHGYYINIELLFNYLKEKQIRVIWTLHDCWAFTGHCAYFTACGCEKWKTCCEKCPQLYTYPKSFVDNSKWNYNKKKQIFTGLNMEIITPSKWLADLVKESFLKEYKVTVKHNTIDTKKFKKLEDLDRKKICEKYGIDYKKKIILGVASEWTERKGLNDFIKVSSLVDAKYQIVLVGLTKKQLKTIPKNIIPILRTNNVYELVELYNISYVFFNPTYEDNYPTVNLEAVACDCKVVSYNTGGCNEIAGNDYSIIPVGDINYFINML